MKTNSIATPSCQDSNDQLDFRLPVSTVRPVRRRAHRPAETNRAAWWFNRMRQEVDRPGDLAWGA